MLRSRAFTRRFARVPVQLSRGWRIQSHCLMWPLNINSLYDQALNQ